MASLSSAIAFPAIHANTTTENNEQMIRRGGQKKCCPKGTNQLWRVVLRDLNY